MRIIFEEVKTTRQKGGKCAVCGKHATRSKTFCHTVNPFNKNADGIPKTRAEVFEDVRRIANAWYNEPVKHTRCE